jgi:hypothetical protein
MVKIKLLCKIIAITAILTILTILTGCPEEIPERDGNITIVNNSQEIIVWATYSNYIGDINPTEYYWGDNIKNVVMPDHSEAEEFHSNSIKSLLQNGWMKYYLFNFDSVRTISWQRICDERIILKEVTFRSWREMEACNFTITYP